MDCIFPFDALLGRSLGGSSEKDMIRWKVSWPYKDMSENWFTLHRSEYQLCELVDPRLDSFIHKSFRAEVLIHMNKIYVNSNLNFLNRWYSG